MTLSDQRLTSPQVMAKTKYVSAVGADGSGVTKKQAKANGTWASIKAGLKRGLNVRMPGAYNPMKPQKLRPASAPIIPSGNRKRNNTQRVIDNDEWLEALSRPESRDSFWSQWNNARSFSEGFTVHNADGSWDNYLHNRSTLPAANSYVHSFSVSHFDNPALVAPEPAFAPAQPPRFAPQYATPSADLSTRPPVRSVAPQLLLPDVPGASYPAAAVVPPGFGRGRPGPFLPVSWAGRSGYRRKRNRKSRSFPPYKISQLYPAERRWLTSRLQLYFWAGLPRAQQDELLALRTKPDYPYK